MERNDSLIGCVIEGGITITSLLGTGASGHVYLGHHEGSNRPCAVKVMRAELAEDSELLERFRREALASSRLSHPNVVRIENFGFLPSRGPYLVMEYLRGQSLRDLLRGLQRVPLYRSYGILHQLCDAVAYAHRHGIVHRDLKPENLILLSRQGRIVRDQLKVLDFGLAKVLDGPAAGNVTAEGQILGTPAYMSPEQCSGQALDHRSDLYSVGILAFEVLTGRLPFQAKRAIDYMIQHAQAAPPAPNSLRADEPLEAEVEEAILRCLAKSPADRWPRAEPLRDLFASQAARARERVERSSFFIEPTRGFGEVSTLHGKGAAKAGGAARGEAASGLDPELAKRGYEWVMERYCQVVRSIAERLMRLEPSLTEMLDAALKEAKAAEDALLREETEIAFLETERESVGDRFLVDLERLHGEIIARLEAREAEVDGGRADPDIRALEEERSALEGERDRALAAADHEIQDRLLGLPDHQRAFTEAHLGLGTAIAPYRVHAERDPKLPGFYDAFERYRGALIHFG